MNNEKFMITKDDTTIHRFIDLYDYFEIDELKIIADVFRLLNDHELSESFYLENGRIKLGVKITPTVKQMHAKNSVDLVNKIQYFDGDNKELYFFKALTEIVSNSSFISINDRLALSNLFDDFSIGQGIGDIREISGDMILPICKSKGTSK